LCIALAGCAPATPKRSLVYGLTLVPSGIDPHINASSELGIALASVYDTLVVLDPATGQFAPGLAERWDISPDGRAYTFHLKSGVRFHDGAPFDAAAVRFNLDRIAATDTHSQKAVFLLGPYERTEVLEPLVAVVHLKQAYAPLLDGLSQVYLGMASPAAVQKWGADYQFHQVGSGPFRFVEYVAADHLTLVRDPTGSASVDEVIFRFFDDPPTRVLALASGEVQVMGEIPPQDAASVESNAKLKLLPVAVPGMPLTVFINSARPPTDDLRVRQALLYATDRSAIVQAVFRNRSPVAYGPLSAVTFAYDPAVQQFYPYDPAQAGRLLDEAGWRATGDGGARQKDGQALEMDLIIQSWGFMPQVAQLLEAQWAQVGIRVKTRQVTYPEALKIGAEGSHHLMPFFTSGTDPDMLRPFFQSGASFNWSKAADAELDAWLDEGAMTLDPAARRALYANVQQRVMASALILPIRDYVNLNGVSAQVENLRFSAHGWFPRLVDVSLAAAP
jgi:peptide/nickel transport system substrate-binding protein